MLEGKAREVSRAPLSRILEATVRGGRPENPGSVFIETTCPQRRSMEPRAQRVSLQRNRKKGLSPPIPQSPSIMPGSKCTYCVLAVCTLSRALPRGGWWCRPYLTDKEAEVRGCQGLADTQAHWREKAQLTPRLPSLLHHRNCHQ